MSDSLQIQSATKKYNVTFKNSLEFVTPIIKNEKSFFVIDEKIFNLYKKLFESISQSRLYIVKAVEENKNIDTALDICDKMMLMDTKKNTMLVSFGGGIVQDITGFVANILYRGIKWTFIPTTLLAACDSCIGGKTSLNYKHYKNMIGTFYPPDSILICPEFFKTLEKRDLYSGLGEVVKFNIIAGEEKLIDLEQKISLLLNNDRDTVVRFVLQSLVFKKTFIEADEFDCGERIKLNFAHTFGHAIEVASKYSISHGTAVAMGLVTADYISVKRNMMSVSLANRVESLIKRIVTMDLSVTAFDIDVIIEAIHKDKKQTSSHITAILLDESYELHITDDISIAEVKKAFDYLIEFLKR